MNIILHALPLKFAIDLASYTNYLKGMLSGMGVLPFF